MSSGQLKSSQILNGVLLLVCFGCSSESEPSNEATAVHELVGAWKIESLPDIPNADMRAVFHADGSLKMMGANGSWETPEPGRLITRLDGIRHGTAGSNITKDYSLALYKIEGDTLYLLRGDIEGKSFNDPSLKWENASVYSRLEK